MNGCHQRGGAEKRNSCLILDAGMKNPVHPIGVTPIPPVSESLLALVDLKLTFLMILLSPWVVTMVAVSFLMMPLASQNLDVKDFLSLI